MTEETQYDVFLSHNSQDKPAVERLARRLTDEVGLRPFSSSTISAALTNQPHNRVGGEF